MPISQKIIVEIDKLDTDEQMKRFMKYLLQLEDDGVRRWNVEYENELKKYIKERQEGES